MQSSSSIRASTKFFRPTPSWNCSKVKALLKAARALSGFNRESPAISYSATSAEIASFSGRPAVSNIPVRPDGKLSVFTDHSGYADASRVGSVDASGAHLYGSNGLTLDREGRIVLDANGDRAVERLEKDGKRTTLADHYEGKRLTCPNDIVVKSDGAIYFTDGMAGCLPKREDDPARELPFHGVYSIRNGSLQLLDKDPGDFPPNGIAFSPDEKILYVNNGGPGPNQRQIFAYDVQPDGTVKNRRLFIDFTGEKGPGGPDGMKVDVMGNLYSTGNGRRVGHFTRGQTPWQNSRSGRNAVFQSDIRGSGQQDSVCCQPKIIVENQAEGCGNSPALRKRTSSENFRSAR